MKAGGGAQLESEQHARELTACLGVRSLQSPKSQRDYPRTEASPESIPRGLGRGWAQLLLSVGWGVSHLSAS